ncbi:MAG: carbamoyltransferase HypF [Clostridiaceae bacterium]|nr:carbamoyltransferase HypF [Clostridiaceae bacterium]
MSKKEPYIFLTDCQGKGIYSTDPIKRTIELVKEGRIIAIKGIGGFHLCCDAMNEEAVAELRRRKNRPHKPLAVMAGNIDTVRKYCEISQQEREILICSKRPIVLLNKNKLCKLPDNVAPNQKRLGIMLPYSPIHHLLFETGIELMVMTSGNKGGMPIQHENEEAIEHLKGIADYFLLHNRDIHNPIDDSVIKVVAEKEMVSRRARGYTPYVQNLGASEEILALGAEQKSTICFSQNGYAYMSQYLGDLKDMDAYELYKKIIGNMTDIFQLKPKVYVHDLHPQYLSTRYAMKQQGRRVAVQHHHAHMVSCMVEHKLFDKVIGVIFDGTGLGNDGSIWGGEFFIGDRRSFQRVGHLKPVLLQGGDMVVLEPWRSAASYLFHLGYCPQEYLESIKSTELEIVQKAIASNFNCCLSSSMGRLFDCVATITGIRQYITYDAQGAIELENIIDSTIGTTSYSYRINENNNVFELDFADIITDLIRDKKCNVLASVMSTKFHNTISNASVDMILRLRNKYHINHVVLSGGVFENIYLLESIYKRLTNEGFNVFFNEQIPINDSGISAGQLAIVNEAIRE